ncbi:hypothetical protein EVAR_27955_1 [Eumeta japonica]|uniref:Uncharacterized protein n=1 Tax=Eumeta variegata TaxID=151549 RepID=A0A4C1ZXZ1_EUMVA|nr:hypothetical protein EVAR_27955_1 [Eumeta japonica]
MHKFTVSSERAIARSLHAYSTPVNYIRTSQHVLVGGRSNNRVVSEQELAIPAEWGRRLGNSVGPPGMAPRGQRARVTRSDRHVKRSHILSEQTIHLVAVDAVTYLAANTLTFALAVRVAHSAGTKTAGARAVSH